MARETHLHDRHRGTVPQAQIPTTLDANARVAVRKNSTGTVYVRRRINLIEGSNVTITIADDSGSEEIDITIAATGGGGGGSDQFDASAPTLSHKTGFYRIAQEDLGFGTQGYLDLNDGDVILFSDTGGGDTSDFEAWGSEAHMRAVGGAGTVQVEVDAGGTGDVNVTAPGNFVAIITNGRHVLAGGKGVQFPELASDPTSPLFENQTYYNTTSHTLRTYDGTSWHDLW